MTILLGSKKSTPGLSGQYSSAPLTKSAAAVKAAHLTQTEKGEGGPTHGPWVGCFFHVFFHRLKQPVVKNW